jgi:hypothetical protein
MIHDLDLKSRGGHPDLSFTFDDKTLAFSGRDGEKVWRLFDIIIDEGYVATTGGFSITIGRMTSLEVLALYFSEGYDVPEELLPKLKDKTPPSAKN